MLFFFHSKKTEVKLKNTFLSNLLKKKMLELQNVDTNELIYPDKLDISGNYFMVWDLKG